MFCRNCGSEVHEDAFACVSCGVRPLDGNKFCNGCGKESNDKAVICVHCGIAFSSSRESQMI